MSMKLTFNPTDFKNIVASIGEPPETEDFSTATDESVERGFVRIDGEVHGEPQSDTVPVFLAGIPTEATLSADELADYENSDGGDLIGSLLNEVFGGKTVEMNPTELARATALFGAPSFPVQGNAAVPVGCIWIDGDEKCDATAGLEHGVLAYAEDGTTLVVTSDDADVISA